MDPMVLPNIFPFLEGTCRQEELPYGDHNKIQEI